MNKVYIGDSVYAEFDGYGIVLTTENGYPDDPRNRIVLEPSVYESLIQYVEGLKRKMQAQAQKETTVTPTSFEDDTDAAFPTTDK